MIGGKTNRKLGQKIVNISDLKNSRNDFNEFLMKIKVETQALKPQLIKTWQ